MTVLVTGGTGRIGRRVIDVLLAQGRSVQVVTRSPYRASQLFGPRVGLIEWHSKTEAFPARACEGATHVLHLMGAPLAAEDAHASHVRATQNMAAALPQSVARVVAATSTHIYPTGGLGPLDETIKLGDPGSKRHALLQDKEKAVYAMALRQPAPVSVAAVRLGHIVDQSIPLGGIAPQLSAIASGASASLNIIGLNDTVRLFLWLLDQPHVQGPVNAVAPNPASLEILQAIASANASDIAAATKSSGTGIWGSLTGGLRAKRRSTDNNVPVIVPAMPLQNGFTFTAPNAADLVVRICPNKPAAPQTPSTSDAPASNAPTDPARL